MNIGIIAEYNPFHNGHKYHLSASKDISSAENVIVVMSGNFVQRGEPAVVNKFLRTKAALLNGADMVIELPTLYSTGSADVFAYGSISLLNSSNIIDCLCFGSEEGKIEPFVSAAKLLSDETAEFKKNLQYELSKGISYPKARETALSKTLKADCSFLNSPNNILSLEYLKSLYSLNSSIKAFTIPRKTADFHSSEIIGEISSASAIRNTINSHSADNLQNILSVCIPHNYLSELLSALSLSVPSLDFYSEILSYILRIKTPEYISSIADITEGLENRIISHSEFSSISQLLTSVGTKRYTASKLRRGILHIILDIKKSDICLSEPLPYIRVLGFRRDKQYLLADLVKKASVPVITNIPKAYKILDKKSLDFLNREIIFTDLYNLSSSKKRNTEYTAPIVVV